MGRKMPIYDFACPKCHQAIEVFVRNPLNFFVCPDCGAQMDKRFSKFSFSVFGMDEGNHLPAGLGGDYRGGKKVRNVPTYRV